MGVDRTGRDSSQTCHRLFLRRSFYGPVVPKPRSLGLYFVFPSLLVECMCNHSFAFIIYYQIIFYANFLLAKFSTVSFSYIVILLSILHISCKGQRTFHINGWVIQRFKLKKKDLQLYKSDYVVYPLSTTALPHSGLLLNQQGTILKGGYWNCTRCKQYNTTLLSYFLEFRRRCIIRAVSWTFILRYTSLGTLLCCFIHVHTKSRW